MRWYDADPRGVVPLNAVHIPHDLKRILRQRRYSVTLNADFVATLKACASARPTTWITDDIIKAYSDLHRLGYAFSIEAWQEGQLSGGLYGVAIGGACFGESMFHYRRDASKVALAHLLKWLQLAGFRLLDIQMITDILKRFGAKYVKREAYLEQLAAAISCERKLKARVVNW